MNQTYDVIIIGGGSYRSGYCARLFAPGIRSLLLERSDIATGATGRNHGLLHSGARYAVTDQESAKECIRENMILRRIAAHCVEETDGLFITLPEDGLEYRPFRRGVSHGRNPHRDPRSRAGPPARTCGQPGSDRCRARSRRCRGSFRLTSSNILDARAHGAEIRTYTEVRELLREQDRIVGVRVYDHRTHSEGELLRPRGCQCRRHLGPRHRRQGGHRGQHASREGALLIFGHRVNRMVLNRCRKPADADILVPGDTISLIGTTSSKVPFDQIDNMIITPRRWTFCCARASWRRRWPRRVSCGPTPVCGRWWPRTTIRAAVRSAAASCCSITPHETVWRDSSPSRVAR